MRKKIFSAVLAAVGLGLLAVPGFAADGSSVGDMLPIIIGAVVVVAVVIAAIAISGKKKASKAAPKTEAAPAEKAPEVKDEPAVEAVAETVVETATEEVKTEEAPAEAAEVPTEEVPETKDEFDVEAADQTIEESKVVNEAPPVDVESNEAEPEEPEIRYEAPAKLESVEVVDEQSAMEVIELDTVEVVGEEITDEEPAAEQIHIDEADVNVETDEVIEESKPVAAEAPIAVEPGEPDPIVVPASDEPAEEAPAAEPELKEGEFRDAETGCIYTYNDKGVPVPPDGMVIRYKWSFLGRLIYADDVIKYRYMMLRRLLLSYKKVRSSVSWNFDSYFLGRKPIAKIRVRGKNITVYFNIDPAELAGTKYVGTDVSKVARYKAVPFAYRITGERKLNYALELIKRVMEDTPCTEPEYIKPAQAKYAIPHKDLGELLAEGYLKIGGFLAVNRDSAAADDDDDEDENIAAEAEAEDDSASPDVTEDAEPIPAEDFKYNPKKGEA